MNFTIGNEHITNQFTNNHFVNAMDITSFLEDGIIFSNGKELPNAEWKEQWMKYCMIIMPHSGYDISLSHPYKSDKYKDITEYEITYKGKIVDSGITWCEENAIAQCYIKISQLSSFSTIVEKGLDKLDSVIEKIPNIRIIQRADRRCVS